MTRVPFPAAPVWDEEEVLEDEALDEAAEELDELEDPTEFEDVEELEEVC
jgi:hypothetical protein